MLEKLKAPILLFTICATLWPSISTAQTYCLTRIEVKAAIAVLDELSITKRHYNSVSSLCVLQTTQLKYANEVIDSLNLSLVNIQKTTDSAINLQLDQVHELNKQLQWQEKKKKVNAILLYVVSGIAAAELAIILAR